MNRTPFHHSLAGRLLLLGGVPSLLAMAALVGLSAFDGWAHLRDAEERTLAAEAEGVAMRFTDRNERFNDIVSMLGIAQSAATFGRRHEASELVRQVAEALPNAVGAWVTYEPDADGLDAKSVEDEVLAPGLAPGGRFAPYWYRDTARGGALALKANAEMETMDYYQGPKRQFAALGGKAAPYLTQPYVYEGVDMVTHTYPVVVDGRFAGVAGVDRELGAMSRTVAAAGERFGIDLFLIAGDGTFIAAGGPRLGLQGDRALIDVPVSQSPFASLAARWNEAQGGQVVRAMDPVLDETCYYAVARVPVGDWTVVARRPESEVLAAATASFRRNVILGIVAMALVASLLFLASRAISQRVRQAAEAAGRFAEGNLAEDIPESTSRDETGQLLRAMRTMARSLGGLVGSVKQQSIALNSTATEIAATAKQQEASASSFGAASSQIAAAVREISATSQELVRTMDNVHADAVETARLASSGRSGLQGMEGVMRDLERATGSIADKLAAINERSQKITTVVTTISKVADQTNILSINAAIEAEKAGEFGSGFLVIAREIRRLADQTAAATLDIEQMVQQMQAAVSTGVMEMDRYADQVRRGVHDVATVGMQLGEILERVNRSVERFRSVNEAMQSQSEGAGQISDGMAQLTANANQTMQSVHEFGRAAEDLQAAIASLREAVAKFHLAE